MLGQVYRYGTVRALMGMRARRGMRRCEVKGYPARVRTSARTSGRGCSDTGVRTSAAKHLACSRECGTCGCGARRQLGRGRDGRGRGQESESKPASACWLGCLRRQPQPGSQQDHTVTQIRQQWGSTDLSKEMCKLTVKSSGLKLVPKFFQKRAVVEAAKRSHSKQELEVGRSRSHGSTRPPCRHVAIDAKRAHCLRVWLSSSAVCPFRHLKQAHPRHACYSAPALASAARPQITIKMTTNRYSARK